MKAMSRDDTLGDNKKVWGRGGSAVEVEASPVVCSKVEVLGIGSTGVRAGADESAGAGAGAGAGTISSGTCIWCISRANCCIASNKYEASSRVEPQAHRLINKQHTSQKRRCDQAQTRSSIRQNGECNMSRERNRIH